MDLLKLFSLQRVLDERIESAHHVQPEEIFEKKLLALLVEIGELANETRCFKFWSTKPPAAKERILDEYADGLHFILSLGLLPGYENQVKIGPSILTGDLTAQFTQLYRVVHAFKETRSLADYQLLLSCYVGLTKALGFTEAETEAAYLLKNEVNHERQESGY